MRLQEKVVVVTRKTRLEELVERFNTREQARFYIEHMGLDFSEYEREHEAYAAAVRRLRHDLDGLERRARCHEVTMAEVRLNDGQSLLAFNDFYLGRRTHVSARYSLTWRGETERQSSSGVLVSTGAGSTGWLSSARNMAAAVSGLLLGGRARDLPPLRL